MSKILLIDDCEATRKLIFTILKTINEVSEILQAKNGNEAIDLIKNQNFDLILLDQIMPDDEGINIMDEILTIKPDIKIYHGYIA